MNVEVCDGVGRTKPLLKIFNECRSLTGVGIYIPNTLVDLAIECKV